MDRCLTYHADETVGPPGSAVILCFDAKHKLVQQSGYDPSPDD